MKKNSSSKSGFVNSRNLVAVLLCPGGISLAMVGFAATPSKQKVTPKQAAPAPSAPSPTGGTLPSTNIGSNNALNYTDSTGSVLNLTFFGGAGTCAVPMSCSTYTVTIDPSVGTASAGYDPTKYNIFIELSWQVAAIDYDTRGCSGRGHCGQANVVASAPSTGHPGPIFPPSQIAP